MGARKKAPSEESIEDLPFEAALERLEGVVDQLEGGDLELEAALQAFERGVKLSAHCASRLDSAERRIEVLMREGERWIARPFASGDDLEPGDDLESGDDLEEDEEPEED